MRLLYVFPHPDDGALGPAAIIHQQLSQGHEVYLLTLTRGEAAPQRQRLGLSEERMAEVRFREMLQASAALGLTGFQVLDFPDGGLREVDPALLEAAVAEQLRTIRPHVVVTYPAHGISGHPDHVATHEAVRRAFMKLERQGEPYLRRLAYYTLSAAADAADGSALSASPKEAIDCVLAVWPEDVEAMRRTLDCYETARSGNGRPEPADAFASRPAVFEIEGENFKPPLADLTLHI